MAEQVDVANAFVLAGGGAGVAGGLEVTIGSNSQYRQVGRVVAVLAAPW